MLKPTRSVAPTATILSLSDAKLHLRVDHDEENGLIADLIAAVDAYFDGWAGILGRCVRAQTWIYRVAELADTRLPFPDVQSAVIRYLDLSQVEQVLPVGNYRVLNDELGGLIQLVDTATQPAVYDRIDAVRIEAVYGMADVPFSLRQAALMHLGYLYRQREGGGEAPAAVHALIAPLRFRSL